MKAQKILMMVMASLCFATTGYSYTLECSTTSKGYSFSNWGYDKETVRSDIIHRCEAHSLTNNGECRAFATCQGDMPGERIVCSTTANNSRFVDGGSSWQANIVRERLRARCESYMGYTAPQCTRAMVCTDASPNPAPVPEPYPPSPIPAPVPAPVPQPVPVPYPPAPAPMPPAPPVDDNRQYVCTTSSNGRDFNVPGKGFYRTRDKVIFACQQSPYTNPYECQQNAYCQ